MCNISKWLPRFVQFERIVRTIRFVNAVRFVQMVRLVIASETINCLQVNSFVDSCNSYKS